MPGGKGKSTGGKAGPKEAAGKTQKSHSAKAGLQVSSQRFEFGNGIEYTRPPSASRVFVTFTRREKSLSGCAEHAAVSTCKALNTFPQLCSTRRVMAITVFALKIPSTC